MDLPPDFLSLCSAVTGTAFDLDGSVADFWRNMVKECAAQAAVTDNDDMGEFSSDEAEDDDDDDHDLLSDDLSPREASSSCSEDDQEYAVTK